jgi:hypothetical protein
MPRHPPCALKNLNTKVTRCSRSLCSSQNTNGHQPTPPPNHPNPHPRNTRGKKYRCGMEARPARTPKPAPPTRRREFEGDLKTTNTRQEQPGVRFLRTQQCAPPSPAHPSDGFPEPGPLRRGRQAVLTSGINQEESNSQCSTNEQPTRRTFACGMSHGPHTPRLNPERVWPVLLRKEVIQPHLPVRLPCYDFVPIAGPTFDGSPHKGWATGFGCCRLS